MNRVNQLDVPKRKEKLEYPATTGLSHTAFPYFPTSFVQRFLEGFDEVGSSGISGYPPVNAVLVEDDENGTAKWEIQVATAGFKKEELSINLREADTVVEISGEKIKDNSDTLKRTEYTKQIGTRKFKRMFTTRVPVDVESAVYEDGLLTVVLVPREPPEGKTVRIS